MQPKVNAERADHENPTWTEDAFAHAQPAAEVLPGLFGEEVAGKMLKPRGRPKASTVRTLISLRLPPETLARWKATGPGWQTRMVEVLAKSAPTSPFQPTPGQPETKS